MNQKKSNYSPKIHHVALLFFFILIFISYDVHASGFGIFTQGADALGQANATVAHADGPSAVFFNPALLPELAGTQLEIGTTAVVPKRKFKSSLNGAREENEDTVYFPSTLYLTHNINDKFSAGLGIFNPFGLGTVWDSDWEGNALATKSRITTFNINPTVAYRVTSRVSIGAGVDILLLDAKLKNKVPGLTAIDQKFTGDGEGVGFNTGLYIDLTERLSFGTAYRSEIKIDIDGKAEFDIPDSLVGFSPLFPDTDGQTSITLPQQVTAGLAYRFSPAWTIEAGLRWEDWESFDELTIELQKAVAFETSVTYPRNWHSTWAYNIGTKYRFNNRLALMAGYLYGKNPIPDSTFEPAIPDSDTHLFTVGTEISFDQFKLAIAYGLQLQEDREKKVNAYDEITNRANGDYENYLHLAAVSLSCAF